MHLIRRNASFVSGRLCRQPPWRSVAAHATTRAYGTVPGGKFQGMSFEEVADNHQQYCQWLVNNGDGEKMGRYREFVGYLQERGFQADGRSAPPAVSTFRPVGTQSSAEVGGVYEITSDAYDVNVIKSGKMKGTSFEQCAAQHPHFCKWVLENYEEKNLERNYREFYEWLRQRQGNENPYPESGSDQRFAAQPDVPNEPPVSAWPATEGGATEGGASEEGSDEIVCFGKYRGSTFQRVLTEDPRYCRWLLSQSETLVGKDGQNAQNFQDFSTFLRSAPLPAESGRAWKAPQAGEARPPNTTIASGLWLVNFGKHNGKTYKDVFTSDRQYCEWLVDRVLNNPDAKLTIDQLSLALFIQLQMRTPKW